MQHTARLDSGMFDAVLSTLHTRTRVLSFQVPGQDVGYTKIEKVIHFNSLIVTGATCTRQRRFQTWPCIRHRCTHALPAAVCIPDSVQLDTYF